MTKRGPHVALLRQSSPCCGDLGQSWSRLETVLNRCWAGFDAVSDRLGIQNDSKTPHGDTKTPPRDATSALEAPKTPPDATKTPAKETGSPKSIEKQTLLAHSMKSDQNITSPLEMHWCRPLEAVLGRLGPVLELLVAILDRLGAD